MSNPLIPSLRVSLAIGFAAFALMMAGCKSDPAGPSDDISIADTDAANLFAAVLGSQSGGFLMQLGDAISVAHGAQFPARPEKRQAPTVLRDTNVARNRTATLDGKTYAFNYAVHYQYFYTKNAFSNPVDYYYQGNTELKCVPTMTGTMTTPRITATDSAWASILMNNTDSTLYTLNGKFFRYGTYTFVGSANKTYTGKIETANMPGLKVDPNTKEIVDGNVEISMKGKKSDGSTVEWAGTYVFRVGQQARLELNGKTFLLDTKKGEATQR